MSSRDSLIFLISSIGKYEHSKSMGIPSLNNKSTKESETIC